MTQTPDRRPGPLLEDEEIRLLTNAVGPTQAGAFNYNGTSFQMRDSIGTFDPRNAASRSVVHWGNNSVSTTTTTRYLSPGWEDGLAPTTVIRWAVPYGGTLRNLRVVHNTPAGNGNAIVYTVQVNGSPSALAVSLASTSSSGSNTSNTVIVVAGDLVDLRVTKTTGIGTSPAGVVASVEIS